MHSVVSFSQRYDEPQGFWVQRYLHGEVSLEGVWRQQKSHYTDNYENWNSIYGIGGIKLYSSSYFWLPTIMTLDLDLEFNPETRKETYIQIPNRNETRTLSKIGVRSTIYRNKPVTVIPFYSYNYNFFNRENLTNVRSKTQTWGGRVLVKNRILPLVFSYNDMKWDQKETDTGRLFTNNRKTFEGRTNWHLFEKDKNEFVYGYDDFTYTYSLSDTTSNNVNRFRMNNTIPLDSARNYVFSSYINYFDQKGTYTFKRFDVNERIDMHLPYNFRLSGLYNYYRLQDLQDLKQNRAGIDLSHKLYRSLRTYLNGQYVHTNQTVYKESNFRFGAGFQYTKKVGSGRLNLSYSYFRNNVDVNSDPSFINVVNESHNLTDGVPTLLERPYVNLNTVIVKDVTGTIVYQLNIDYILIERNNFVEIQRIIGGQIPNGGGVLIDYVAMQPGDYRYDLNNHRVYAGFMFFGRLIEIYYRGGFQDYTNVEQSDFLTLKYFHQNVFGIRIEKAFARGGVEYDSFNSNIIPYHMMRYYLNLNKNFKNKLLLSLNASLRDYQYLDDDTGQILGNVSGMASYFFKPLTKLEFEAGYLRHKAYMTDLNLWTGRLKFSTVFRQLYLDAGFDFYSRNYAITKFTMNGVYVRLTRKF